VVTILVVATTMAGGCEFIGLGGGPSGDDGSKPKKKSGSPSSTGANSSNDDSNESTEDDSSDDSKSREASASPDSERDEPPSANNANEGNRSGEKRNPFAAELDVEKTQQSNEETSERELAPLEQFAVGSLRLAAIISEVAVPKAMFIDPNGLGHVAKEGDRIGENGGVLKEIRNREVVIELPAQVEESAPRQKTIELGKAKLPTVQQESDQLSDDQQKALEDLLQSEEGRRALQESYEKVAPSSAATENKEQPDDRRRRRDERFPGLRPPEQQ
jgi:Tfp pilus assembly protein PilP